MDLPGKKKKYFQKFCPEWTEKWSFIVEDKNSSHTAVCKTCSRSINIGNGGISLIEKHIKSKSHENNAKSVENSKNIKELFQPSTSMDMNVTKAEVKLIACMVKKNIPFSFSDDLFSLLPQVFPDSKIASKLRCKRNKTTHIVTQALAPHFQKNIVETMKSKPFSVSTDGSNDTGIQKMNPVCVRMFDEIQGKVLPHVLDMGLTDSGTAESVFNKLDGVLSKHDIQWNNCTGLGVDNTNSNVGRHNSLKTRVLGKNGSVYISGCPCHIIHNTAEKASQEFQKVVKFSVRDMCIHLYHYFDKSTKRKQTLQEYCTFCDVDFLEMIRYVPTRWLSLERAVSRVLKQFEALKSHFLSEDVQNDRFKSLKEAFEDPLCEIVLLFYQNALQQFIKSNKILQSEKPLIPVLHEELQTFVERLAGHFLKQEQINAQGFQDIDPQNSENQKANHDIEVGYLTKKRVNSLVNDGYEREVTKFRKGVFAFYSKAFSYAKKNLPINEDLLKNAQFIDVRKRISSDFSQVEYFIERFPLLSKYKENDMYEQLHSEFLDYKGLPDNQLDSVLQCKYDDGLLPFDRIWKLLGDMKSSVTDEKKFANLLSVVETVLVIPHSNACSERVFSMIKKSVTSMRSSLDLDTTVGSIMTTKLALEGLSGDFEPDNDLLVKAKKACMSYKDEHKKND